MSTSDELEFELPNRGDDRPGIDDLEDLEAEAAEDDGEPFEEKMRRFTATLREQQAEAAKLDAAIVANLKDLGYDGT